MAIGTVICIVLGVIARRAAWLREPLLAVASVAITIPSLALFAIFIPVVGIGNTPAIIALVIYSLMPILRNTITGLDGVDPAIVEAAKGVGLSGFQRLRIVELPLRVARHPHRSAHLGVAQHRHRSHRRARRG
ncbi:MAG: ABC transporter permease subunit [Microthrixaceae bacterium]